MQNGEDKNFRHKVRQEVRYDKTNPPSHKRDGGVKFLSYGSSNAEPERVSSIKLVPFYDIL